jgi:CBS domain-containing protein
MSSEDSTEDPVVGLASDPTHRIGRLPSAKAPVEWVTPDATLEKIITKMLEKDFSQLPVMTEGRRHHLKGIVSWKTIGRRLALKQTCEYARDCMEEAVVCKLDESLLSAIKLVAQRDYVLLQGPDQEICGIVTPADLNDEFRVLTERFLLVEEVEKGIRRLLNGKYTLEELQATRAAQVRDRIRQVESVADLTFGDYVRLIDSVDSWKKLKLAIDRAEFVKLLRDVGDIRNKLMHFRSDGLSERELSRLREAASFLKRLRGAGIN